MKKLSALILILLGSPVGASEIVGECLLLDDVAQYDPIFGTYVDLVFRPTGSTETVTFVAAGTTGAGLLCSPFEPQEAILTFRIEPQVSEFNGGFVLYALEALELTAAALFEDGFESGDLSEWEEDYDNLPPDEVLLSFDIEGDLSAIQEFPGTSLAEAMVSLHRTARVFLGFPTPSNISRSLRFLLHVTADDAATTVSAELYENDQLVRELLLDGQLVSTVGPGEGAVLVAPFQLDELVDPTGAGVEILIHVRGKPSPPGQGRLEAVGLQIQAPG